MKREKSKKARLSKEKSKKARLSKKGAIEEFFRILLWVIVFVLLFIGLFIMLRKLDVIG